MPAQVAEVAARQGVRPVPIFLERASLSYNYCLVGVLLPLTTEESTIAKGATASKKQIAMPRIVGRGRDETNQPSPRLASTRHTASTARVPLFSAIDLLIRVIHHHCTKGVVSDSQAP